MEDSLKSWLFDPAMGKLVTASVGLIVIVVLVRLSQRSLGRYIQNTETRYRTRKVVTILGYFVAFFFLGRSSARRSDSSPSPSGWPAPGSPSPSRR